MTSPSIRLAVPTCTTKKHKVQAAANFAHRQVTILRPTRNCTPVQMTGTSNLLPSATINSAMPILQRFTAASLKPFGLVQKCAASSSESEVERPPKTFGSPISMHPGAPKLRFC